MLAIVGPVTDKSVLPPKSKLLVAVIVLPEKVICLNIFQLAVLPLAIATVPAVPAELGDHRIAPEAVPLIATASVMVWVIELLTIIRLGPVTERDLIRELLPELLSQKAPEPEQADTVMFP